MKYALALTVVLASLSLSACQPSQPCEKYGTRTVLVPVGKPVHMQPVTKRYCVKYRVR